MKITVYDVARACNLSITTVSRVINNKGGVSATTEKKVRAAIEQLGYTPDSNARGLAASVVGTIGFVIDDTIGGSYLTEFLRGAQKAASAHGFDILLITPSGTPEQFTKTVLGRRKIDGLIFPMDNDYLKPVFDSGLPVSYGGERKIWDDKGMEVYAGFSGYRKKALQILSAAGCQKILYIEGESEQDKNRRLWRRRNLKLIEEYALAHRLAQESIEYFPFRSSNPQQLFDRLYQRLVENPPDGIFVINAAIAAQVSSIAAVCGINIPEQLKLITVIQNPQEGSVNRPPLTALLVNTYLQGYHAALKLCQVIQGGMAAPTLSQIPFQVVERGSV